MNTIIQTPTNKLSQSLDFYKKLNFKIISEESPCIISDGKVLIEINPDRYARAGMKIFRESWKETVAQLEKQTKVHPQENGYLIGDPSGTRIYLIEQRQEFPLPQIGPSTLGNFAGMSLETTDINRSVALYEILGFKKTMGDIEQGWVLYANEDGMGVSFMKPGSCPHLFFNPSLTYFNGKDNMNVIQKIRDADVPIAEEITFFNKEGIVDNVILRDPGGYGFFIFSD